MFCGTHNIPHNIFYIQSGCGEYYVEYYQSHETLLWILIMLWSPYTYELLTSQEHNFDQRKLFILKIILCLQLSTNYNICNANQSMWCFSFFI